jgi:DtxR family Mn-dependent transcriptional regulator
LSLILYDICHYNYLDYCGMISIVRLTLSILRKFVMGHHHTASESIEMYLLRIVLLQNGEQPVPVPRLAQELEVSPASANEMCRKLAEKGLIQYAPYKGVSLTEQGNSMARRVLRHRRLWEVFFVNKLEIDPVTAEEIACRFEHVTPEFLADKLDSFLEHPGLSPQNQPIPRNEGIHPQPDTQPLTTLAVGAQGQIALVDVDTITQNFLCGQGLQNGTKIRVVAAANDGPVLLDIDGQRLSLAANIAASVAITHIEPAEASC